MSGEELRISPAGRAVALGLSLLLVGLKLSAILGPHEAWPFSSAPMFARYHARADPVYHLEWWLVSSSGKRLLEPRRDLGIGELPFRRGYFARYYGSADERHPGGHFPGDTPADFERRHHDYCRRLHAAFRKRGGAEPVRFALEISERRSGLTTLRRALGECDGERFRRPP